MKNTKKVEKSPIELVTKAKLLEGTGIPLGLKKTEKGILPLHYSEDRHLVTFGPTGSGKNTTAQTPALLEDDASAFVIDVKGQLCAITSTKRLAMGHEVAVINPFETLSIPSVTYNPLRHINPKAVSFFSDCLRIAEGLVLITKNDHWEQSALDVVHLLIMWVCIAEEDKSLIRVREILNQPETKRQDCFEDISKKAAEQNLPYIAEGAARYALDTREVNDCIQTAVVHLTFLRDPAIEKVLHGGPDEINFAELKKSNMTIFVIIPPELLHTHGRFLRLLFLAALGELIRERHRPLKPVLFLLDEFAQLGHLAMIENAAAIVRDYNVRLWIILQNLPQLKALYGETWESFISSAGVIQGFTPNDLQTADYFSQRSGKIILPKESYGFGQNENFKSEGSSQNTNINHVEEPYLKKEEILDMREDRHILLCTGVSHAIVAKRVSYRENDKYNQNECKEPEIVYDEDPYHMSNERREEFARRARSREWPTSTPQKWQT